MIRIDTSQIDLQGFNAHSRNLLKSSPMNEMINTDRTNEMTDDETRYHTNDWHHGVRCSGYDAMTSRYRQGSGSTDDVSVSDDCDSYGRPYCSSSFILDITSRLSRIQSENVTTLDRIQRESKSMFCLVDKQECDLKNWIDMT